MPCYRSCKRMVPRYIPAYDETRQNSSSVYSPCDLSYAARHQPYYYSHGFTFEPGTTDPAVPQTPVIVPQDAIATTFHYDLDDEFELDEEEIELSEEEDDDNGEEEVEVENRAAQAILAAVLAYVIPALLAFLVWVFYFA